MKNVPTTSRLLLLFLAVALSGSFADAQTRPATPPTTRVTPNSAATRTTAPRNHSVAVVDINYIFKNHAGFKATMDKMKDEVKAFDDQMRNAQQSLQKERDRLNDYRPGSPEYQKLERDLADQFAKAQVDAQLKRKEFLERESRVYFAVYNEVSEAIRQFADQNGIDLVLRYTGDGIDPEDRQSVLQGVNRAIIYQRDLDITREILDRLNRSPRVSSRPAPTR